VIESIEIHDYDQWDITQVTMSQSIRRLSSERKKSLLGNSLDRKLVINEDIHVIEYSPDVFAFLRARDGYDNSVLR